MAKKNSFSCATSGNEIGESDETFLENLFKVESNQSEDNMVLGNHSSEIENVRNLETTSKNDSNVKDSNQGSEGGQSKMSRDSGEIVESEFGLVSRDELKKLRHRKAQDKYKKKVRENYKELKEMKKFSDAQIETMADENCRKDSLIQELQAVITVQNEELHTLKRKVHSQDNIIVDLANQNSQLKNELEFHRHHN